MTAVSVIVPVRNEAAQLGEVLASLRRAMHQQDELIVVDGGSSDDSAAIAARFADQVVQAPAGRARQMNAGAAVAQGQWLWFVHADSQLLPAHRDAIAAMPQHALWGRFDVRLSGTRLMYGVIARLMNVRSRISGIATGDQAIVVRQSAFAGMGGFADQPLMEDVALSAALRRKAMPRCLRPPLVTSSRRWEQNGIWRTIWLMWTLRWRYWRGEDPVQLHRDYYRH